jgi:hypothetical protein
MGGALCETHHGARGSEVMGVASLYPSYEVHMTHRAPPAAQSDKIREFFFVSRMKT